MRSKNLSCEIFTLMLLLFVVFFFVRLRLIGLLLFRLSAMRVRWFIYLYVVQAKALVVKFFFFVERMISK